MEKSSGKPSSRKKSGRPWPGWAPRAVPVRLNRPAVNYWRCSYRSITCWEYAVPGAVADAGRVRHEIHHVIGVQVADDDRVDRGVVDRLAQLREHARAAIKQHGLPAALHEIARAGAVRVLPRGRFAQHRYAHALSDPPRVGPYRRRRARADIVSRGAPGSLVGTRGPMPRLPLNPR